MSDRIDDDSAAQRWLVNQIRAGDTDAWQTLIDRYEGRLLAYTRSRLTARSAAEDIVQETFVGFLTSLPNYDGRRNLEAYLFSICGYKLTDHLRRAGRRPTVPLVGSSGPGIDPPGARGGASTIHRSIERKQLEADAIAAAIAEQIERWRAAGQWTKLIAMELLFVRGTGNKDVAAATGLSEQQIANYKSDFITRLRSVISRMDLDPAVFPELMDE